MRVRRSARLLVIDGARVLLFRYVNTDTDEGYWGTPGGALEDGETFAQAAVRELKEETGLVADAVGGEVGRNRFAMDLRTGERVVADEWYFVVSAPHGIAIGDEQWRTVKEEMVTEARWWSAEELAATSDVVYPANLRQLLRDAGVW